jgi:prepilin-type N-terminal cleavage/methylation domain-containing protein
MEREDGFTLIELLAVMIVMAVLLSIAVGFQTSARVRAGDAAAKSNIDVAVVAISAYGADNGGYTGMTLGELRTSYGGPGVADVAIVSANATSYCVASTVEGRSWYKLGPAGSITTTPCA